MDWSKDIIKITNNEDKWMAFLEEKLNDSSLNESESAYYKRIKRVLDMPNLAHSQWNPINMVVNSIVNSNYFQWFDIIQVPEIVTEWETFDLFFFPENHVARRPSDSYFLNKSNISIESILLRPHTTVMWYYYLKHWNGNQILENEWEIKALSYGKVYRVDELDKSHHECFHQIDWFKIAKKSKEIINQDTLKQVLSNTIHALFWDNVEFRFNVDTFPYTLDSLEVEVNVDGKWLEVLWAWVIHPTVLEMLWIDPNEYNGWAFGFGIERLAMARKQIPDIRIFWSNDSRITSQWWHWNPYKAVSVFPPVFKDISFLVNKEKFIKDLEEEKKSGELELTRDTESHFFALTWVIRDVCGDLIEEVKITDIYENDAKFGKDYKSISIKITFRSIERTLTNEEINITYFQIRDKIENVLGYELR